MLSVCIWCDKYLGEKPPYGGLDNKWDLEISYDICKECEERIGEGSRIYEECG